MFFHLCVAENKKDILNNIDVAVDGKWIINLLRAAALLTNKTGRANCKYNDTSTVRWICANIIYQLAIFVVVGFQNYEMTGGRWYFMYFVLLAAEMRNVKGNSGRWVAGKSVEWVWHFGWGMLYLLALLFRHRHRPLTMMEEDWCLFLAPKWAYRYPIYTCTHMPKAKAWIVHRKNNIQLTNGQSLSLYLHNYFTKCDWSKSWKSSLP